jgi:hypothetical protein
MGSAAAFQLKFSGLLREIPAQPGLNRMFGEMEERNEVPA